MLLLLLATAMASGVIQEATPDTDTTVTVQRGTRLVLRTTGGTIRVRGWGQDRVRLRAQHSSRIQIELDRDGAVLQVRVRGRLGPAGVIDYEVNVPTWMALDLGGLAADVDVEGTTGEIHAESTRGDLRVRGGDGVALSTTQGAITLQGSRGRALLHAVAGDIDVQGHVGDVEAESVGGSLLISGGSPSSVDAQTIGGDVTYRGPLARDGRYILNSHAGTVLVAVPGNTSASVSAATIMGEFSTTFPGILTSRSNGRRYAFRLGEGSAVLELETFSGEIRLIRLTQ